MVRFIRSAVDVSSVAVIFSCFLLASCGGGVTSAGAGTVILTSEADWVAFQDGPSGSWTVVAPDGGSGTTYTLDVTDTDGRYGIATHRFSTPLNAEWMKIIQATRDDATNVTLGMDDTRGTINATVSNFAGSSGSVGTKGYTSLVTGDGLFPLTAYTGTRDVITVEKNASSEFLRGVSSRSLSVSAGGTTATTLDYSGFDLSKTTTQTFTVTGGSGSVALHTATGTTAGVSESGNNYAYLNGPIPGDMYFFQVLATGKGLSEFYSASSNPGNRTADPTLINSLTGVTMDYSGLSGLSYTPAASSPVMHSFNVTASQNRTPQKVSYFMTLTKNWLGSDTTYSRPSFSGLPGYNTNWDFTNGVLVSGLAYSLMLSGAGPFNFDGNTQAIAGMVRHTASASVSFTP